MKTTMTAGRSSENGGRFAGGHFAGGHYTNMPRQCGWMVFPMVESEGKPSSRGETFHHNTHTAMTYLLYYTEQTPIW